MSYIDTVAWHTRSEARRGGDDDPVIDDGNLGDIGILSRRERPAAGGVTQLVMRRPQARRQHDQLAEDLALGRWGGKKIVKAVSRAVAAPVKAIAKAPVIVAKTISAVGRDAGLVVKGVGTGAGSLIKGVGQGAGAVVGGVVGAGAGLVTGISSGFAKPKAPGADADPGADAGGGSSTVGSPIPFGGFQLVTDGTSWYVQATSTSPQPYADLQGGPYPSQAAAQAAVTAAMQAPAAPPIAATANQAPIPYGSSPSYGGQSNMFASSPGASSDPFQPGYDDSMVDAYSGDTSDSIEEGGGDPMMTDLVSDDSSASADYGDDSGDDDATYVEPGQSGFDGFNIKQLVSGAKKTITQVRDTVKSLVPGAGGAVTADDTAVEADASPAYMPAGRRSSSDPLLWVGGGLGALAVIALIGYLATRRPAAPPAPATNPRRRRSRRR